MKPSRRLARTHLAAVVAFAAAAPLALAQHSIAREWNELLLRSISRDQARPTIHARNLYHTSVAMWDSWATYDPVAKCVIFGEWHPTTSPAIDALREETMSFACYRLLRWRFANSPGAPVVLPLYDALMARHGFNIANTSTVGNTPAEIGNRIAAAVIAYGLADNSNEANGYANQFYQPVNTALIPTLPGNPNLTNPNRWQPLSLQYFVSQSGVPVPTGYPPALSPEWGQVKPFALSQQDLTVGQRDNFDYWIYHDPGSPPLLGSATAADYKWSFEMVVAWSSHLDPDDGVMIDISPASLGNAPLPTTPAQVQQFYDFYNGGDWGTGYTLNPVTGLPYTPQIVPRGDYTRVLAEFWADGPTSTTPPGHWFEILNTVSDNSLLVKRIGGVGPVVGNLEWDVKSYLALGGAMHDCAVCIWGLKGWYDFVRPVSAIRYMADRYYANPSHPHAITLHPGLIEEVTAATTAPGQRHAHLAGHEGKVAIRAWRGPPYTGSPPSATAGVGWILAANWWPYQRATFVTPPFAGFPSGHSGYSRAAAVVLHRLTGSPWFPGGLGEWRFPKNNYLVHEPGPSQNITLQWASYYDASNQTSLSRIWGGIHPPADDIPSRFLGQRIGNDAMDRAELMWAGTPPPLAAYTTYGAGCPGAGGTVTLTGVPSQRPVIGSTLRVDVTNLPSSPSAVIMLVGTTAVVPGVDLGVLGAPGCTLDTDILSFALLAPSLSHGGWIASWSMAIPNDPSWLGQSIYNQVATRDPTANPFGVTTSNAGHAFVGM